MLWERLLEGPFLVPQPGTLASQAVTTPEVLRFAGRLRLYVGAVSGERERIVGFDLDPGWLSVGKAFRLPDAARVAIDTGPNRFDSSHVFDPAAIEVDGQAYLYYSAIAPEGDTLGLATSPDGIHFVKRDAPLQPGRAPGVVRAADRFHLFYVLPGPGTGYAIFSSVSQNGTRFAPVQTGPVLDVGRAGGWDGFEVTTPRPFARSGATYLLYAGEGDRHRKDKPRSFGLARSFDLVHWERYPGNPVFRVGPPGAWDDEAIWFGSVFPWENRLYLLYEGGRGAGINRQGPPLTQVGLAVLEGETFDRKMAEWPISSRWSP
jgi:hypothetical protein